MAINDKVLKIIKQSTIKNNDVIGYLLNVYFGYIPSYTPPEFVSEVMKLDIVKIEDKKITWVIPLFKEVEDAFDWVVDEYVQLFKNKNPNKLMNNKECIKRMKKFFSDYPKYRKEDVILATEMYLSKVDPRFMMYPHYFITKGRGIDKVENLLANIEAYQEATEVVKGTGLDNKMQ